MFDVLIGLVLLFLVFLVVFTPVLLSEMSPSNRKTVRDVIDYASRVNGRPIRRWGPFLGGSVVGTDGERIFVQISYADTREFGGPMGPPRQYFALHTETNQICHITPAEVRPHKKRIWC